MQQGRASLGKTDFSVGMSQHAFLQAVRTESGRSLGSPAQP